MSTHAWCRRLVEGLEAADVNDLVVSPGSRSTPLLLAAIESELTIHSVIDERSAAFFALGRARAEHKPVAFLCTSGSAGAHALPALLEARYAGHRVVALTADRPPELHGCGANQTIDQEYLFAAACPPCLDLGVPEDSESARLAMRDRVHAALCTAQGPLHINLPFRKPLEPSEAEVAAALATSAMASIQRPTKLVDETRILAIAKACQSAERGVIVAGASVGCGPALHKLAMASGFVLLAESTSGARYSGETQPQRCDAFPHVLTTAMRDPKLGEALRPDLVLRIGREPACASLNRWLSQQSCPEFRFTDNASMREPGGTSELVRGEVADACQRLALSLTSKTPTPYLKAWRADDEDAWTRVSKEVDEGHGALSEARAMAGIVAGLPKDSRLTLGNSMPVRSLDMVLPGHRASLEILHQRGTSGIDGLIAGAIGSSDAGPSALLIGDVSFAHDIASLALAPLCRGPLGIWVVDNQGGQIFSHLPIASAGLAQDQQALWRTPPSVDIKEACRAYAIPYQRVDTPDALTAALRWSGEQESCHLVQVCVPATSMLGFVQRMAGGPVS